VGTEQQLDIISQAMLDARLEDACSFNPQVRDMKRSFSQ
jgi:hypothetical protein